MFSIRTRGRRHGRGVNTLKIIRPQRDDHPPIVVRERFWQGINSLDAEEILELYRETGVILFRGFRLTAENFRAFGDQFCTGFVRNRAAGRKDISKDSRIQTVNLGGTMFPFHPEISREPWKPDVIFFGCMGAPTKGGDTQLVDGVRIVRAMKPATREKLLQQKLLYQHPTTRESCARWLGIDNPDAETLAQMQDSKPFRFHINPKGNYIRAFNAPTLHRPMFIDEPAFGNHILFSRFRHNIRNFPLLADGSEIPEEQCQEINELAYSLCYTHEWQKNDLLMIDNTRFMHGRPEFIDDGARVILSQFGYLKCAKIADEDRAWQPWRNTPVWIEEDAT